MNIISLANAVIIQHFVTDAHEETVYHFPLSIVYRTFLNATIHAPFSMVTSENLDQTDLPSLNVIISARIPEVTGPNTPIQKAQIHNMSSGQTDFCHQENVTEIVTYLLDIGAYNLTVDVLASCQFRSGSPPQGTVCSVNRPGKPFLQLRRELSCNLFQWRRQEFVMGGLGSQGKFHFPK